MNARPTRETVEGRAYLDLQILARKTGRPTDELHQLYALEGFLDRLTRSPYVDQFVLKGGVLLAAYNIRRPTREVDLSASAIANEVDAVRHLIEEVLAVDVDDGLVFDVAGTTVELIRDGDDYSGVRVHAGGRLSAARLSFHVDVNVGDPIVPLPATVAFPRLLGGDLRVAGYPIEMVLAEKIVTAVQRGTANTRWRDFVDIAALAANQEVDGYRLETSLRTVAQHRAALLVPLAEVLAGFPEFAQGRWERWRAKHQLQASTPKNFHDLLAAVITFSEIPISGTAGGYTWNPATRSWS